MVLNISRSSKSLSSYTSPSFGKRKYSNRQNPCPICDRHKGCSEYKDSGLIECLRGKSQQDAPAGYRFIRLLTGDMGGMFAPDNDIDGSLYQKREQVESTASIPVKRLGIKERHLGYRKLASKQDLSGHHFSLLLDRGLNINQINQIYDLSWIRSWYSRENPVGINRDLAGVHPVTGDLGAVDGISIAALDPDGHITGLQIAADNRSFAKYLWASSFSQGGSSPHLPNGELPLFCWRHPDQKQKVKEVWLCEGALKSLLVALFLWSKGYRYIAVIGTASSARYGRKTLEEYLTRLQPKRIALMPDAGAIANKQILPALKQTIRDCQLWGYEIHVGWWGQVDKSHPDIDELLAKGNEKETDKGSDIQFLIPKSFEDLIENDGVQPQKPEAVVKEQEQEEEKNKTITADEWQHRYGLPNWIKQQVNQISRRVVGFKQKPKKQINVIRQTDTRQIILFQPGCIPWKKSYKGLPFTIRFKVRERILVYQECVLKGWKDILDISQPGTGKSHDTGNLTPQMFFGKEDSSDDLTASQNKIIYLSQSGRNPTVETIERNFTPLPVRHDGMKYDFSRKTPMGKPYEVWAGKGEAKDTVSNCHLALVHQQLAGRFLNEGKPTSGKNTKNPICQNCPYFTKDGETGCKGSEGEGYGFKYLMKVALQSALIRATPQGLPSDLKGNYGLVIDEALSVLSQVIKIRVTSDDINQIAAVIYKSDRELYQQLSGWLTQLDVMVRGIEKAPNFGFTLTDIQQTLGEKPDHLDEIIQRLQVIIHKEAKENIETFIKSDIKNPDLIEQLIIKNWFLPFLKVYTGTTRGSLRIVTGEIQITLINQRELNTLKQAQFRIYQDATGRVNRLAQFLQVEPDDILVCEQMPPKYNHVNVVQIQGLPELGKDRSDNADKRVAALVQKITTIHNDVGVIDWKNKAEDGTINHFSGGRGSNLYIHKDAIAIVGLAYQNLSAVQDKYQTITGYAVQLGNREGVETDPELQAYINELVEDETFQEIGRIRASRRLDNLSIYVMSDFPLDNLLTKLTGCHFKQIEAFNFTPEAGTQTQVSRWKLLEAFKLLVQKGHDITKMTQNALAEVLEYSRSRIAQIASEFGGWKPFKRMLEVLINGSIKGTNNLTDEERWLAETYLPLVVEENDPITEIASLVKVHGIEGVMKILSATSGMTQTKVLIEMFNLIPEIRHNMDHFATQLVFDE